MKRMLYILIASAVFMYFSIPVFATPEDTIYNDTTRGITFKAVESTVNEDSDEAVESTVNEDSDEAVESTVNEDSDEAVESTVNEDSDEAVESTVNEDSDEAVESTVNEDSDEAVESTVNEDSDEAVESTVNEDSETADSSDEASEEEKLFNEIIDDIIYSTEIEETEQVLVTIMRPESHENTFNESYVICGITDKDNIRVTIAILDEETGEYEYFEDVEGEGESSWDVGSFGLFTKEVLLKKGANHLKIVAFDKTEIDNLELNVSLQVNYFTVTLLEESIKDRIIRSFIRMTQIFNAIF